MRHLFAIFLLASTLAHAQFSTTATRILRGSGAPSAGSCTVAGDVGKVYWRSDTAAFNASWYGCSKTGASAYGWELVARGAAGITQCTDTSASTTAYTCTSAPTLPAVLYAVISFIPATTNTGAATIAIDSLGAKALRNTAGAAFAAGQLVASTTYLFVYESVGGIFRLVSPAGTSTSTNCTSSASPAACGAAAAGSVVVAAAATTVVVNTTAVTANSQIFLMYDSSLGTKLGVTCNVTEPALYGVTARTAGTSFTITATAPVTNGACLSFFLVN